MDKLFLRVVHAGGEHYLSVNDISSIGFKSTNTEKYMMEIILSGNELLNLLIEKDEMDLIKDVLYPMTILEDARGWEDDEDESDN